MSGRDFLVCVENELHVYIDGPRAPLTCCGISVAGLTFGGAATPEQIGETQRRAIAHAKREDRCIACGRRLGVTTWDRASMETYHREARCPRCGPLAAETAETAQPASANSVTSPKEL